MCVCVLGVCVCVCACLAVTVSKVSWTLVLYVLINRLASTMTVSFCADDLICLLISGVIPSTTQQLRNDRFDNAQLPRVVVLLYKVIEWKHTQKLVRECVRPYC